MFGFLKKRAERARQETIDQFNSAIEKLKIADESVNFSVGHGINMASSFFFKKFEDVSNFQLLPKAEKINFVQDLATTGDEVRKKDQLMGLGFSLFKMWIVAIMQEDMELAKYFSENLSNISKSCDI